MTSTDQTYEYDPYEPAPSEKTPRWRQVSSILFWTVFWLLYVLWTSLVMIFGEGRERVQALPIPVQILISPLMIPILWFLLHGFKNTLKGLIRAVPLPTLAKYLGFGLITCVVLGVNFTTSFGMSGTDHYQTGQPGADLHPNPFINTLLYLGPYAGTMLAWYVMRHWYVFDYRHVFWLAGIAGGLGEPSKAATEDFIVIQMFFGGAPDEALLTYLTLIAAYGVPMASIWVIMPEEELPKTQRRPGCLGFFLLLLVPTITSYISPIVTFGIIDLILGTNFLD